MVKILDRYIALMILKVTALIGLIIMGILFLINLMGEVKNVGEGDYGMLQVVLYVILQLPNQLYQFFPMLILLGSIVGLSVLSGTKELAVMRTSGFSVRRIMQSTFLAAFLLVLVVSVLGELVGPKWSHQAEVNKENAQNAGQAVVTATGMWLHADNNFIHISNVVNRSRLEGVTRYHFDGQHRLIASYYSKTLNYENGKWVMHNGVRTNFYNQRTQSLKFDRADWDLPFNKNLLNIGLIEASEMSLPKLAQFIRYLEKNGLQANEYKHEFWQRALQPLACLIMIFLAMPFVLGAMTVMTIGWRVLLGIIVGFSFFILNAFLGELSIVFQIPAFLAAVLPLIIFSIVGALLMRSVMRQ